MDSFIRPFSYLAFVAALAAEGWILFWAPSPTQDRYLFPVTILLTALMATCGWMWSGHTNRKLARKTEAVKLLLSLRVKEVNDWKKEVYNYIEDQKTDESTKIPIESVEKLLGLYEFLSICVMRGVADEETIKESQSFVFLRLFGGLRVHIQNQQETEPSIYCHFEHYTRKWNKNRSRFDPTYVKKDREFL